MASRSFEKSSADAFGSSGTDAGRAAGTAAGGGRDFSIATGAGFADIAVGAEVETAASFAPNDSAGFGAGSGVR